LNAISPWHSPFLLLLVTNHLSPLP
jgi:hypothetical protein